MKTLTRTVLAGLATGLISCALFSQQSQADHLTGKIVFGGIVDFDQPVGTATQVIAWHGPGGIGNPTVTAATGSFAISGIVPGDSGSFHAPWNLDSGHIYPFFTVGGFTFELGNSSIVFQGGVPDASVLVVGTGAMSGNGFFESSYGTFYFQAGGTNGPSGGTTARFSFTAPDTGSTAALLSLALVGVEALRRKMRTARHPMN